MHDIFQDVRFALRLLRKSPGFTAVSVAILALGIGANTAIFTLVNRVMLRPLPYPRPAELMSVSLTAKSPAMHALADGDELPFSYPKLRSLSESDRAFSALAGFSDDEANWTGAGDPERIRIEFVTGRYFDLLEIHAVAGRFLTAADDAAGAAPTTIAGAAPAASSAAVRKRPATA